ncbi:MAG: DUF4112 domain-containing protein [Chthoniobacterales bacterium]|nr:DUF4112 domain-containing protein [Chthoniobacterales bacterium]
MTRKSTEAQEVEWEVLPPEEKEKRSEVEPLFRWLALIMDNFLRVPGTQFRFGLDPLMGLLPGLGDTGSAVISAMALIAAARRGLPKILLARMSLNILINEAIGIVPVVGDAFSFWFKSNARNYELLKRHTAGTRTTTASDWIFVALVLALLFFILLLSMAVSLWLLTQVVQFLGGARA